MMSQTPCSAILQMLAKNIISKKNKLQKFRQIDFTQKLEVSKLENV